MSESEPLSRVDGLCFDIDLRLRRLWVEIENVIEWDIEQVAAFMRVAYAQGYYDALREDEEGDRERLSRDNGYDV